MIFSTITIASSVAFFGTDSLGISAALAVVLIVAISISFNIVFFIRNGGADIFLDCFIQIIQAYVCTPLGSYSPKIVLFVLYYTR